MGGCLSRTARIASQDYATPSWVALLGPGRQICQICKAIRKARALRSPRAIHPYMLSNQLKLSCCMFTDEDALPILEELCKGSKFFVSLWLDGNRLTQSSVAPLVKACYALPNLHTLDLSNNNMSSTDTFFLQSNFGTTKHLRCLRLHGNAQSDESVRALRKSFSSQGCMRLEVLTLGPGPLSSEGIADLCHCLHARPSVLELDLVALDLRSEGISQIADELESLFDLQKLAIRNDAIGSLGVEMIAAAIQEQRNLRQLHLEDVQCGDEGAIALVKPLCKLRRLASLNLANNWIGDAGAMALAQLLTLFVNNMDVSNNLIRCKGMQALVSALQDNLLGHLVATGNECTPRDMERIYNKLCRSPHSLDWRVQIDVPSHFSSTENSVHTSVSKQH